MCESLIQFASCQNRKLELEMDHLLAMRTVKISRVMSEHGKQTMR
jgi:hypothetical protein